MFRDNRGYHRNIDTWGYYSDSEKAASELALYEHLKTVPPGGRVLDIGAGMGLSLSAAIYTRRPDIKVINLDPGFADKDSMSDVASCLPETIDFFSPDLQGRLEESNQWRRRLVAAAAEDLPLEDESVDMVVSYSSVLEYSNDFEPILNEALRVLRAGQLAIHGPMRAEWFARWDALTQSALDQGLISDYMPRQDIMETSHGNSIDAYFSLIRK